MRARARGAGLLMAVLLIVTVASFAVIVAASQLGGDVQGNDALADSIEALYLAESGVERALKRYASGAATCTTLAETITDLSQFGPVGDFPRGRTVTILDGLTTDLANPPVTLVASQTQCRVRVTATIGGSNVSRTIHAIVDRNLLEGPDNPTFNNPLTGVPPSGWGALNPNNAFAANGSADGTAPTCGRSAWQVKQNAAPARRATASVPVQFTLAAGSTTTVYFYRRALSRTADCGALPGAGAALPAACVAGNDTTVCFQLVGLNTTPAAQTWTVGSNLAVGAGPGGATCPATFNPCSLSYPGYPAKSSVAVLMTNAASVSSILYHLQVQNAGRKELFLDHIEMVNPSAVGAAHVRVWRDCSAAADPATCL